MIIHNELNHTNIDVRSSSEFHEGIILGSVDMTLLSTPERIKDIMQLPMPIAICSSSVA
jgi:hypothetical protein